MKKIKKIIPLILFALLLSGVSCNSQPKPVSTEKNQEAKEIKYKVTFVELGSVRCIPCQQMQPVMKSVEKKYPTQVKVVFHDVWTDAGAPMQNNMVLKPSLPRFFSTKKGKNISDMWDSSRRKSL
ncbi:MAG: thioredoxin family protein [Flavobacteriaceae bacterium]|nr:thioredoxin family protein [Flavobacteriaceae bacterium]